MKRVIAALMICCLAALLPVLASGEEGLLRGYSREEGYVYLTLGEYPQTEDGGGISPGARFPRTRRRRTTAGMITGTS